VRELSGWVAANGGNIVHADHHSDQGAGLFLSRLEWQLEGFGLPREAICPTARALADRLGGEYKVNFSDLPRPCSDLCEQAGPLPAGSVVAHSDR